MTIRRFITMCAVAALGLGTAVDIVAAADKPFKIAILLPGSTSDNGYNADGGNTATVLRNTLKADVQVTENVPVANQADLYRQ